MIDWFQNNKTNVRPINLGILYFEEPDEVAHKYGPDTDNSVTKEVQEKIFELDDILGYIKKKLVETNLIDEMNIILTSDHGQTDIGKNKMINLDKFVSRSLYTTRGIGLGSLVTNMNPTKGITISYLCFKTIKIHFFLNDPLLMSSCKSHYSSIRLVSHVA
jgi:predicted AlkP superfamily pyrophosphatase or phosphodiesterase